MTTRPLNQSTTAWSVTATTIAPKSGDSLTISNILSASTINSSYLAPQKVEFLSADSSTPLGTKDTNQRQVYINSVGFAGFTTISGALPTWSIPTCAENDNYNSITMVGTEDGYIFYTSDSGSTWTQYMFQFNGRINQMYHIGAGFTLVVGNFTHIDPGGANQALNYACYINNWSNYAQPFVWYNTSDIGFNGEVKCVEVISNYFYFGGSFTSDNANSIPVPYLAIVDSNTLVLSSVDGLGTSGSVNGAVYFIKHDTSNPGYLILGGQFNYFTHINSGFTCNYLCYWNVGNGGGYNTLSAQPLASLDNYPLCISQNGAEIYIGGNFSANPGGNTSYAFKMTWNGGYYDYNDWFYGPSSPVTIIYNSPNGNHIYNTESSGELFKDGAYLGNAPSGVWSVIIYNQFSSGEDWFATNSGSSSPYPFYYYSITNNKLISLNNPVWYNGTQYGINISLGAIGYSVELIWNAGDYCWYVVGYTQASFT